MKILLVDDHAIVRKGISQLLARTKAEVDEASSCSEALTKVAGKDYDIVLLDISMPGRNGLETLKLLRNDRPKLPVLILTMYPEEQYAIRAMKSGASGYLTKDCNPKELLAAIGKITRGGEICQRNSAWNFCRRIDERLSERKSSSRSFIRPRIPDCPLDC